MIVLYSVCQLFLLFNANCFKESSVRPTPMSRILLVNRETWPYLFVGLLGCCLSGIVPPFFALVYSQIFSVSIFTIICIVSSCNNREVFRILSILDSK